MNRGISADIPLRLTDGVMACDLGDGLALLDHGSGTFYTLDAVGAFIWNSLSTPKTTAEINDALLSVFDASAEDVAHDVGDFIQAMVDANLVRVEALTA